MVLTVRGTSQVPVYPGRLFSWVPLSFLGSLNVSLQSWLYLQYAHCSFQLLLEVWLLDMSSMSDLPQVFRTEMRLADVTVVQKLDCSVTYRGIPASFVPTHSFPEFSLFWGAFLSRTLFFPSFIPSPLIIRKLAWLTFSQTQLLLSLMIDFTSPKGFVISSGAREDTSTGFVHCALINLALSELGSICPRC